MVFDCLCERRSLHKNAIVTFDGLMMKDKVQDLIKRASEKRSKDFMSPLGELISFVRMTNEFIKMHDFDPGVPIYDR